MLGEVITVFPDRGYGFIKAVNVKNAVFFHIRAVSEAQYRFDMSGLLGRWVAFKMELQPDGRERAVDIRVDSEDRRFSRS